MNVAVVGIDIAKRVFQVHGVAANGEIAIRRKLSRDAFLRFSQRCQPAVSGLRPDPVHTTGHVS